MKKQTKTWKFTYWFEGSDWFEWETEITPEEDAIIRESIANGVLLDDVSKLSSLLDRVYEEIRESVSEEYEDDSFLDEDDEDDDYYEEENEDDPCEGLTVHFQDPNEPFYNIE